MKLFTEKDLSTGTQFPSLYADRSELVLDQTDWQKRGLQQTATGYGRKLNTGYKVNFEGKLYRVYCTCFSNVGSCWFTVKGRKLFIN